MRKKLIESIHWDIDNAVFENLKLSLSEKGFSQTKLKTDYSVIWKIQEPIDNSVWVGLGQLVDSKTHQYDYSNT